jgi:hypothetical protein
VNIGMPFCAAAPRQSRPATGALTAETLSDAIDKAFF